LHCLEAWRTLEVVPDAGVDNDRRARHGSVDLGQRSSAGRDRHIGQVDIDRQSRHVPDEEIDGGTALQRKTSLFGNEREDANKQRDLPAVDVTKGHSDPPAR
jgi:hypothetical protein